MQKISDLNSNKLRWYLTENLKVDLSLSKCIRVFMYGCVCVRICWPHLKPLLTFVSSGWGSCWWLRRRLGSRCQASRIRPPRRRWSDGRWRWLWCGTLSSWPVAQNTWFRWRYHQIHRNPSPSQSPRLCACPRDGRRCPAWDPSRSPRSKPSPAACMWLSSAGPS